jgi:hypothetical protein
MPYYPDLTPVITDFDPLGGITRTNWHFSMYGFPDENTFYFFPGTNQEIPDKTNVITLPNYNITLGNTVYSQYKIKSLKFGSNSSFEHIILTSDISQEGVIIDEDNLVFEDVFSYEDLEDSTADSDNKLDIVMRYIIQGNRISTGEWENLYSVYIRIAVQKVDAGNFYLNPSVVNFNYILGETERPVVTAMLYSRPGVLVTLQNDFELVGDTVPNPITWLGRTAYSYTNTSQLQIKLKESADARVDELRTSESVLDVYFGNNYAGRKSLTGDIMVSSSPEFTFQPQMLNFLVVLGTEIDIYQFLKIDGTGSWSLSSPSWLSLSHYSGTNSFEIVVHLIDQEYLPPGLYENDIVLTANEEEYKIPVRLKVAERFEIGLSKSGLNFTDENTAISRVYNNSPQESYVTVDVEVSPIGYPYATTLPKNFQYRIGFFENKAEIHIGEIVKRSLRSLDANSVFKLLGNILQQGINTNLIEYYKPSSVNVKCRLYNASDNSLVDQQENKLIRFITGRNPFFEENLALLRDKDVEQKVTKSSFRLINFVTREKVVLEIFKNGKLHDSYEEEIKIERLYGLLVEFSKFEIGDEIIYQFHPKEIGFIKKFAQRVSFIVYPEGKSFNQVVYEDEYSVPQLFDFCGDWRFSSENEIIQSKDVINLVESIKNEKSLRTLTLVMNTGYIPASNQIYLEQVQNSKNCWLLGNSTEPLVELVPMAYNMVNYDSDLDLYQYDVEFQINPTNDLQNYS